MNWVLSRHLGALGTQGPYDQSRGGGATLKGSESSRVLISPIGMIRRSEMRLARSLLVPAL